MFINDQNLIPQPYHMQNYAVGSGTSLDVFINLGHVVRNSAFSLSSLISTQSTLIQYNYTEKENKI